MTRCATVPGPDQSERDVLDARALAWQRRPVLRDVYHRYFEEMISYLPRRDDHPAGPFGRVVEIGSGAGNFKSFFSDAIATDIVANPWVDLAADATRLPFADASVDALVMQDVLHHLPHPLEFFREAQRVLSPGGRVILTEPYISPVSRVVYGMVHPEPHDMRVKLFGAPGESDPPAFAATGAFAANQAVPTVLFYKHQREFHARFPALRLAHRLRRSVLVHPLSGGFSGPVLLPKFSLPLAWLVEDLLLPLAPLLAFRLVVVVEKTGAGI